MAVTSDLQVGSSVEARGMRVFTVEPRSRRGKAWLARTVPDAAGFGSVSVAESALFDLIRLAENEGLQVQALRCQHCPRMATVFKSEDPYFTARFCKTHALIDTWFKIVVVVGLLVGAAVLGEVLRGLGVI
jgi:hypothetical protein